MKNIYFTSVSKYISTLGLNNECLKINGILASFFIISERKLFTSVESINSLVKLLPKELPIFKAIDKIKEEEPLSHRLWYSVF